MAFHDIGNFLKRFKGILPTDRVVRDGLRVAIREHTGIDLSEREVAVRGAVAYLMTDPRVKSEIFLRRGEILRSVNDRAPVGEKRVTEIK